VSAPGAMISSSLAVMPLGVFDDFCRQHPIAFATWRCRANTVSFAAGLAMTGFRVIIYNIAPFVLYRATSRCRNDICFQALRWCCRDRRGITYAPMSMSHYAVEDLGVLRRCRSYRDIPHGPVEAKGSSGLCP